MTDAELRDVAAALEELQGIKKGWRVAASLRAVRYELAARSRAAKRRVSARLAARVELPKQRCRRCGRLGRVILTRRLENKRVFRCAKCRDQDTGKPLRWKGIICTTSKACP